jgi:hypothetical protein
MALLQCFDVLGVAEAAGELRRHQRDEDVEVEVVGQDGVDSRRQRRVLVDQQRLMPGQERPVAPSRTPVAVALASTARRDSTTRLAAPVEPEVSTMIGSGSPGSYSQSRSASTTSRGVPLTGRR